CVGALTTSLWSTRQHLEEQLQIKNHDNAAALAISLSQQNGDTNAISLLVAAQYDTGHYLRIRLLDTAGTPLINLSGNAPPVTVPAWFVKLLPIESTPGIANVSAGWRQIGSIEVVSHTIFAYGTLWGTATRLALLLALVGLVSGIFGTLAIRRTLKPLASMVNQAHALSEGRFIKSTPSTVPELKSLTHAMNSMIDRVQAQFEGHATTVEELRRAAATDPVTGLPDREQFQILFQQILDDMQLSQTGSFALLRVRDLPTLNQELGRLQTDQLLQKLSEKLLVFSDQHPGAACGRLNGSDFALCIPDREISTREMEALLTSLSAVNLRLSGGLSLAIGATTIRADLPRSQLLANADMALAKAESSEHGLATYNKETAPPQLMGQYDWRKELQQTVALRRIELDFRPVIGSDGALLHQQVEPNIAFATSDAYFAPAEWMPFAIRTGMISAIEEIALEKCVQAAVASDRDDLTLRLSEPTLRDSTLLAHLSRLLESHPSAAARICIEIPEIVIFRDPEFGIDLSQLLRRMGIRTGIADSGIYFSRIPALPSMQLSHIKVSASLSRTRSAAETAYLAGIIALAHGMGIKVFLSAPQRSEEPLPPGTLNIDGRVT
ncbi:MAG: EAL domain-containing protein, partial [Burkholderiales bacterium]|nr:EAL domain-containing protein [Burkholderiales bacterium]